VIHLLHVFKSYDENEALRDVTLHVRKGEFVFLTGPSGAGKSTILRVILASEEVNAGQVLIDGTNIAHIKRRSLPYLRRNIGVVFQDFKLIGSRSVFDNVALALEVVGTSAPLIERRVEAVLEQVGLARMADRLPPTLSGGEQQRVAIARAIVSDPVILLADEPTGNLDPELSREIVDILERVHRKGTTVLMATHDLPLVDSKHYRHVRLMKGRVVDDGRGQTAMTMLEPLR
jgi:cell division transport system ATP-binding protein